MNETSGGQCSRSESCEVSSGFFTDCCDETLRIVRGHFSNGGNTTVLCRCHDVKPASVSENLIFVHFFLVCLAVGFLFLFLRRPRGEKKKKSRVDLSIDSLVGEKAPEGDVCCVCLDALADDDQSARPQNCRHYAHRRCMINWIKEDSQRLHLACPMCLQPFVDESPPADPAVPPEQTTTTTTTESDVP